jgi:hypothetical protein
MLVRSPAYFIDFSDQPSSPCAKVKAIRRIDHEIAGTDRGGNDCAWLKNAE